LQSIPEGTIVQVLSVQPVKESVVVPANIPPEIQQLIQDFAVVFEKPQGLPPPRSFAHQIPLLPGAKPVFIRPFRYAVAIKDEIEKQVSEMLESGIIQHSTSPFSSPVLPVKKKKYNTCRFCVDYKHSNALTVKNVYLVPVIDKFQDELAKASWFTTLNLTAGYHQVYL